MNTQLEKLLEQAPELILTYGTRILVAILIFFIGKFIVGGISKSIESVMTKRGVDPTIGKFVKNIVHYTGLMVILIAALGELGIQTASFVAVIGAAGLAVGLALQGSLSNFASGVLIILFRPIRVGDYVEVAGTAGSVKEISLFTTTLTSPDNKTIIVANSSVLNNNIVNYSTQEQRRVDLKIGISYSANIQLAKDTLQKLANEDERVLKDKDIKIAVAELADSSINIVFRVWVNSPDYWDVYFSLTEKVKLSFDEAGIEIPFPQMDVHLNNAA